MEKLSPERLKANLSKKGLEVTLEQAVMVLNFLRKMADITVDSYLAKAHENKESKN